MPSVWIFYCRNFGEVQNLELGKSSDSPVAYVQFSKRSQAEQAKSALADHLHLQSVYARCQGLPQKLIQSLPFRIGWSDSSSLSNCLHISFESSIATQNASKFNEPSVKEYFEKFGRIERVVLPLSKTGLYKGFGDVFFTNNETGQEVFFWLLLLIYSFPFVLFRSSSL